MVNPLDVKKVSIPGLLGSRHKRRDPTALWRGDKTDISHILHVPFSHSRNTHEHKQLQQSLRAPSFKVKHSQSDTLKKNVKRQTIKNA